MNFSVNLSRLSHAIGTLCKSFVAIACALLAVLIAVVVFQRFVTHATPRWAEELPRLILVWSAFIGGVACSRDRSHLMAGLLPVLIKNQRVLAALDRLNHTLIVAGLLALGWAGWQLAMITMDQMLPAIDVSAGVIYLAVPVACALTAVVHLAQCFEPWPPARAETIPVE